ncbi:MAG: diguanylate cyclase [Candidatus Aminicenantes bacterium]|nr:diguanylate cyclase [Candidatus Aminicenantes bacterium]
MDKKTRKNKKTVDQTADTSVTSLVEDKPKLAYLFFLSGPLKGQLFPLSQGTTVLGRNQDSDIVINEKRISRSHLKLKRTGTKVVIEDQGSTNGTFVNGEKVKVKTLNQNDKVHLSPISIFKFFFADEDEKVAIDELYELGVRDPLTGAFNKRYLMERLEEEMSHAQRHQVPLSLVMVDIDRFKEINDTYGHLVGDHVLIRLAEGIKSICRRADIFARYGGEEFCLILRNTDEKGASVHAERIRELIQNKSIDTEGNKIKITLSLGVASLSDKTEYKNHKQFIQAADRCLYHSKKHGRNRTTAASEIIAS